MVKPGYKQTELGIIPEDWDYTVWENAGSGFSSGATPYRGIKRYYSGNVKWVSSGELNYNVINETLEHISDEAKTKTNLKLHPANTFLMAITGLEAAGTRGSCAILGVPATTNQSCMAVYETDRLNIRYLFYFYSKNGDDFAFKYCQGTKQQSYTAAIVKKLPIILPPVSEQKRIAEALSDVDSMISSLEKLITKEKAVKQGAMQELLTGKKRLPGFLGKWESKGNIFSFAKGTQINNSLLNEMDTYPVYNGGREPSGFTDSFNCTGTIIISEGGNSCGFVNRTKQNFWAGGHCYYIYESDLNFDFLYHLLKFCENNIMGLRVGSGLPNIQKDALSKMKFLYPSDHAEQIAIASILSDMDNEIEALEQKLAKTRQIKQGMMQQLLTGKIRLV